MKSTYALLGLPTEVMVIVFVLSLVATFAPYTSGIDIGVFRVPKLPVRLRHRLRYFGPVILVIVLILFVPFWTSRPSMSLDIYSGDQSLFPDDKTISYVLENTQGEIRISPSFGYQSTFDKGGPIAPIGFEYEPFRWVFPKLDIKITNNTSHTIYYTEALFHIDKSVPDPTPLIVVKPDSSRWNSMHFFLTNEGWGKAGDLKVRFHLTPISTALPSPRFDEPYPHEIDVGDLTTKANVSVESALKDEGVDLAGLASVTEKVFEPESERILALAKPFLGPFKAGGALLSGVLDFSAQSTSGVAQQKSVKFSTIVWLYNEFAAGAPAPPTYGYGVEFDSENSNYKRRVSLSQALKPGEVDRFTIVVGVDRSSFHQFVFELVAEDGTSFKSQPVVLHVVIPRSSARFLAARALEQLETSAPRKAVLPSDATPPADVSPPAEGASH